MDRGERLRAKLLANFLRALGPAAIVLGGGTLGTPLYGESRQVSSAPRVTCPALVPAVKGQTATLPCVVVNTSGKTLYLLAEPFTLEGPKRASDPYIYFAVAGERIENVLRFDRNPHWGILIKPAVHIERSSLRRLVRIEPEATMRLAVLWEIPSDATYPSLGDWVAQLKIVFLDEAKLTELGANPALSPSCRSDLLSGVKGAAENSSLELKTTRPKPGARYEYDGCRDVISEAFQHAFSDRIKLRVKLAQGHGL